MSDKRADRDQRLAVASRIRRAVIRLGLTQAQFGRRLGVSQPTARSLMHGLCSAEKYLARIADATEVPEAWLRTGSPALRDRVDGDAGFFVDIAGQEAAWLHNEYERRQAARKPPGQDRPGNILDWTASRWAKLYERRTGKRLSASDRRRLARGHRAFKAYADATPARLESHYRGHELSAYTLDTILACLSACRSKPKADAKRIDDAIESMLKRQVLSGAAADADALADLTARTGRAAWTGMNA